MPMVNLADQLEDAGHTVTLFSNKYNEDKVKKIVQNYELQANLEFPDDVTRDQMLHGWEGQTKGKVTPIMCDPKLVGPFKERLEAIKADIVVCDMATGFGAMAADELGLPVIILAPKRVQLLENQYELKVPTPDRTCRCCGFLCILPNFMDLSMIVHHWSAMSGDLSNFYRSQPKRTVICNAFFGIDKSIHLPPNIRVTGPHLRNDPDRHYRRLNKINRDLAEWLDDAQRNDEQVLYISLGTEVKW